MMLPRRAGPVPPVGTPLRLVAGSATGGRFVLQDLTDDSPLTRWVSTEFQRGDEQILVELDGVRRVTGVILSMGPFAEEYPRRLRIETSTDGTTWNTATEEAPAGLAFSAILHDARRSRLSFHLPDVESRYVRLRQLGADTKRYWSVTDITIVGQ